MSEIFARKIKTLVLAAVLLVFAIAFLPWISLADGAQSKVRKESLEDKESYLPSADTAKILSVTTGGSASAVVVIQTQAVAVKETGPKETVAHFGEVYAFSPAFIAVHRDEPTWIRFWNLQPDDDHDFMLMDPHFSVLMKARLPALKETSFVFTFHQEGLFDFVCAMHRPEMNGQILVLPPRPR